MKLHRLLFIGIAVALTVQAFGQQSKKPYNAVTARVTSVSVNAQQVRFIRASNSTYQFVFTCNEDADQESCKALSVGSDYTIFDDGPPFFYKCDEYRLYRAPGDWSIVCLKDVSIN